MWRSSACRSALTVWTNRTLVESARMPSSWIRAMSSVGPALPSAGTSASPPEKQPGAIRRFLAKYGAVGLGVSCAVSVISFSSCYFLVSTGMDVSGWINWLLDATEWTQWRMKDSSKSGNVVVAIALHKFLAPVRYGAVFAATPYVQRHVNPAWIARANQWLGLGNVSQAPPS